MTHITSTHLADGRELLYFDDAGSARPRSVETTPDLRDLPARGEPGEVRFDALTGGFAVDLSPDACALGLPLGRRNSTIFRPPNNERLAPACASSLQSNERPGS